MKNILSLLLASSALWGNPSRAVDGFRIAPARRFTRVELYGRGKGRNRRKHLPKVPIGGRWDDGVKTEISRVGGQFVVETIAENFRAKKTFPTERAALDYFHEEAV